MTRRPSTSTPHTSPPPRPLLGLVLLLLGAGALFFGLYLLLGTLNALSGGGADAEFRSLSSVLFLGAFLLVLPGAIATWAGWRFLSR